MVILASLVSAITIYLCSDKISSLLFSTNQYGYIFRFSSIVIPLINVNTIGLIVLRYEKRNFHYLIIIFVKFLLTFLFVNLFIYRLPINIISVFYIQVASLIISSCLLMFFLRSDLVLVFDISFVRKSLKYALPQFPARIGSVLLSQTNRFFMLYFLPLSAIGIYSSSLKIASIMQMFYAAFVMAWNPLMFSLFKKNNNKQLFSKLFPLILSVIYWIVSFLTLISKELYNLLLSNDFSIGYIYFGGLAFYYILYIVKELVDIGPKYLEKTKFLSLTFLLSLFINLLSLYIFIKLFALSGVVLSLIITNLFIVIFSWMISNRLYPINFSKFFFALLTFPIFILVIIMMYVDFSFYIRGILLFFYSLFYFFPMCYFLRKIKNKF